MSQLPKTKAEAIDLWLDEPVRIDNLLAYTLFLLSLSATYVLKIPAPSVVQTSIYSVLAASAISLLGFIAAALTLVVGFIPNAAHAFNKTTIDQLFREFKRASWASIACFLLSMAGMMCPHRPLLMLVAAASIYTLSSIGRTIHIMFVLNHSVVQAYAAQMQKDQEKLLDVGPMENLPDSEAVIKKKREP